MLDTRCLEQIMPKQIGLGILLLLCLYFFFFFIYFVLSKMFYSLKREVETHGRVSLDLSSACKIR